MASRRISKIAICGGGIGGMAAAAFICKHSDISIDIYESKPDISTAGAGIAIWKKSWRLLQDLGLEAEVSKRNLPLPKEGEIRGPTFRKSDQATEGFDFYSHMMPYGPTTMTRPILLDMLRTRLTSQCIVHTSKRLIKYEETPSQSIVLTFADGSQASADVLIGADGVHSTVRRTMYEEAILKSPSQTEAYKQFIEPIWSGTFAYRCIVQRATLQRLYPDHKALAAPKIWCGKGKHVVSNPFGPIIHLVCFYTVASGEGTSYNEPWVMDVAREEVIGRYQGWEPELLKLLENLESPSRWAIHIVRPLPFSVLGQVALLGDAAHAMLPHQAVGGGTAIEDAHLLSYLVTQTDVTQAKTQQLLQIYQQIRLPKGAKAAELSRMNGLMYQFLHPDFTHSHPSSDELKALGEAIGNSFAWLADGAYDDDTQHAQALLLSSLSGPDCAA